MGGGDGHARPYFPKPVLFGFFYQARTSVISLPIGNCHNSHALRTNIMSGDWFCLLPIIYEKVLENRAASFAQLSENSKKCRIKKNKASKLHLFSAIFYTDRIEPSQRGKKSRLPEVCIIS